MHRHLAFAAALLFTTLPAAGALASPTSSWGPKLGNPIGFHLELAGRDLNGTDLAGDSLDGRRAIGAHYGGWIDGAPMKDLRIKGSELIAFDHKGRRVNRHKLVGAELMAALDDNSTLPLLITAAERHPDKGFHDVWGYELWYETGSGWEPYCGLDDEGDALQAIALQGRWSYDQGVAGGGDYIDDPDAYTLACDGFVIAKCVTGGYMPWREALSCTQGQGCARFSLADHHQACTRALRADYLGDGTPHTSNGMAVNLYDALGIRYDSEPWSFEAEWDVDGARCLAATRLGDLPGELAALFDPDCGQPSSLWNGALLFSEVP
jgi:hypothetical protein